MNSTERKELPPKQLSMVADAGAGSRLAPVELPAGYALRTYRPGDEESWAELLELAGFGGWTAERCRAYLEESNRRRGSHLVEWNGGIVAATFATPHGKDPNIGFLDYVIAHPEHRNRRLGRAVCAGVMRYFAAAGRTRTRLQTDDWRLPAIKLYLNLGFQPIMNRVDMPLRWEAIFAQLEQGAAQRLSAFLSNNPREDFHYGQDRHHWRGQRLR